MNSKIADILTGLFICLGFLALLAAVVFAQSQDPRLDQIRDQRQRWINEYQRGADMVDAIKRMDNAEKNLTRIYQEEQGILNEQKKKVEEEKKAE
jgi:hypothetical protein